MDRIRLLTNLIDMCIGAIQAGLEWSPSTSSPSAAIGNSSMWSEVIGGEFSAYEQPLACSPNAATGTALICSIHRRHRSVELNQFLAKIDSRVRLGSFFIESTPRDTSSTLLPCIHAVSPEVYVTFSLVDKGEFGVRRLSV